MMPRLPSIPLMVIGWLAGCGAPSRIAPQAEPLPAWEEAFRKDSRWRGADGCYSVALSPTRVLWLFGDTWITAPDAKGREGARMARNTLAIQEKGGPPAFFWRDDGDAFAPPSGPGWLWPLSGARRGDTLVLFFMQLVSVTTGMGFASSRSLLAVIPNPDDPPEKWRVEWTEIPFFRHTEKGDLIFGTASLVEAGFLYIYGVREDWSRGMGGRSFILARTRTVRDFPSWRFWSGTDWTDGVEKAAALFDEAGTESSVSWMPGLKRFVAVYSHFGLSEKIHARLAERPEGPWGEPIVLYSSPDISWNKNYFSYAGKAHPELASAPDELIITYATNSSDFGDHFRDMRLYWPRFVRVKLPR